MQNPYMHVVGAPREMKGKGAPRPTISGVLGQTTMEEPYSKSLGGLVRNTKLNTLNRSVYMPAYAVAQNTDHCIVGPAGMTRMPSAHYGQVPYVGQFIDKVGVSLS
jgi:hypothetical protein